MKKIFLSILISLITITNIIVPISVLAAAPPTIALQFGKDQGHTSDNLRAWDFNITTTGIQDGDVVSFTFSANGVDVTSDFGYVSIKINGGTGSYFTGFILKPATTYKITANSGTTSTSFEQLTLGTSTTPPPSTDTTTPYFFISSIDNGVKGLPTGYKDLATCNTARDVFMSGFSDTTKSTMGQCYQMTVADAQSKENARLNAPVGGVVNVDAVNSGTNSSVYTLLAPIPGLKPCLDWNTDPTKKNPNCMGANIGDYLNVIFKLLIGICIFLAVIMLIIYGIMYMGEESIFGKVEAKSKMISAIFGLLIALGAWALLNTLNPALTGAGGFNINSASSDITPLYDRGINDPKNAAGESIRCTPVTNTSSPCTVANLTPIFGADNAVAMSKICNMESGGNSIASGTDVCQPGGTPFSFGLFQINLSANGVWAGTECVGLFDKPVTGADAIIPKYNSGFSCTLLTGKDDLYNSCKAKLLDPTTNLAIAKSLFTTSKSAWKGDKAACASAFQ